MIITAYNEYVKQAATLEELDGAAEFDYQDPEQNQEARSHVYAIRQARAALDKTRKEQKAESLARGRLIDSEAKLIAERFTVMIDRHQAPLTAIEALEEARKAELANRLDALRALSTPTNELVSAAALRESLIQVIELAGSEWQEYAELAAAAAADGEQYLETAIAQADASEARDVELEQARAELAGIEQARADQEAELKRIEDEAEAERQRIARDAQVARDTEERLAQEAATEQRNAARRAKRRRENEAHVEKIRSEAAAGLVACGIEQELAEQIIGWIATDRIPHASLQL
jgi:hypothetical protein